MIRFHFAALAPDASWVHWHIHLFCVRENAGWSPLRGNLASHHRSEDAELQQVAAGMCHRSRQKLQQDGPVCARRPQDQGDDETSGSRRPLVCQKYMREL